MGIFDFFKKKSVGEKVEVGSLSYGDAEKVFGEMVRVLKERERVVLSEIAGKFEDFYVSVEEKLGVLERIDIESKKEYERAKILVRQGLDKYVGLVRGLLKELKKLNGERGVGVRGIGVLDAGGLVGFVNEIGKVFVGFEKASAKVYERATYLVGDEMMAVRNEVRKFYNGLLKIFDGEKSLIIGLRMCSEIRLKFGEVGRMEDRLKEFEREVLVNEDGVVKLKKMVDNLREEIDLIKKSSDYLEGLRAKEKVGVLSRMLDGEIVRLKGLVDFKKLIGIVHVNERELGIVKRFRDAFVSEFSSGSGKLLGILESCGMMSSEVEGQVALVGKIRGELGEMKKLIGVDVVVGKLEEVRKIEGEIELKRISGVKVCLRLKEIGLKLDGLKDEVVGLVGGLGKSL